MALHLLNLFFVDVFLFYLPLPQQGTPTCFAKALILLRYILKKKKKREWNWNNPTHPVTCVFSDENLVVGVPEANGAIVGGADTQVALSSELAEGKARHHVFVARELT